MPDFPALPLRQPVVRERTTRPAPRPTLRGPGPEIQARRLDPFFERLTAAFDSQRVSVPGEPGAHEPELVLVLEIAGELSEFVNAMRRVPGLEFLAEQLEDEVEPDEFAAVDRDGREHRYARQVFLVASDAEAWREMVSLWERFKRGEGFPRGFAQFRDLFELLRELRAWDDRDRLDLAGAAEVWQRELRAAGDELVQFEAELWWRSDPQRRQANVALLRSDVETAGGAISADYELDEIAYHGVLASAPASLLLEAARTREVRWLSTIGVRLFHAAGQLAAPEPSEVEEGAPAEVLAAPLLSREPRLALLDGLPVERHELLIDRIAVDDPEQWAATLPVARRRHGTAMASLIVNGDLSAGEMPLSELIYVRPILRGDAPDWVDGAPEELPRNRLAVDFVHAAVARLFDGERVAPGVRVIVLAVADSSQPFNRFVSPLARLIDWLSFRYSVVFLVAGGNHLQALEVAEDVVAGGVPDELEHEFLLALVRAAALRRPLSPGEAINAVTVGASHSDRAGAVADGTRLDPLMTPELASVIGPIGPGVRRSVKPEVLLPGGRQLVRIDPPRAGWGSATPVVSTRAPGLRAAAPGSGATALRATGYGCGTSGATALAGREMVKLLREIEALRSLFGDRLADPTLDVLLAKAALVHRASWGLARAPVEAALDELGVRGQRDRVARLLGYGLARPDGVLRCDTHQATVFAVDRIGAGVAHAYSFPLPPSLSARAVERRVTLTLAWLTPINPVHRAYRRAAMTLEPLGAERSALGQGNEITRNAARRGTLQHEVLIGNRAVPYAPGAAVELVVSCRADAGVLDVLVPYALLATVEVPVAVGLPIYEEIRQALRIPVLVQPVA